VTYFELRDTELWDHVFYIINVFSDTIFIHNFSGSMYNLHTHTALRHTLFLITTLNLSLNEHILEGYFINSLQGAPIVGATM
jgi:hypothetical protein